MKANELMQGYIVLYEYDGQKFPARVIEIYRNSVLVESIDGEYEPIEIEEDKIFPVSLTPEILQKNEFDYFNGSWWYKDFHISLSCTKDLTLVCGRTIQFSFIHELQHCLKLVGIEKDIVL